MDDPTIQETPTGWLVTLPIPDGNVKMHFEDVEQSKSHVLEAELTVWEELPGQGVNPLSARLNVLSLSGRDQYRRQLDDAYGKGQWSILLARGCRMLRESWAEKDRSVDLSDVPPAPEEPYLLRPFLARGPTIFFGKGDSAKTWMALAMTRALVVTEPFLGASWDFAAPVLFVDYEADEGTLALRCELLGGMPRGMRYWRGGGTPFAEHVLGLKKVVAQHGIGFVVVDSAALACGGEPEKPEPALRYFNALAQIGVPSLTIAHVTKDEKKSDQMPFGSVFWNTSARCTWNVKGEHDEDGAIHIGLFQRKANNDRERQKPIGAVMRVEDGRVWFEREEIGERFGTALPVHERIRRLLLKTGKLKAGEIAEELEIDAAQVRRNLNQIMKDARKFGDEWGIAGAAE